ncbi:hypothetical protein [Acinetobacter colistiniresistens]|uniref:hypothetical protein n=1 Tax=Acinetobacter colistiniresistens TaxID=280145 RepID=UPI0012502243|nr:hypothetical protein [Acinetobacter colistiniresistens]
MSNPHLIYLDSRMGSFKGDPVRIFAAFDTRNNSIVVANLLPFRPSTDESMLSPEEIEKRKAIKRNSIIVTDCPDAFEDYNIAFNPNDHLDIAALAYMTYERQGVLVIDDELKGRANVASVMDGKRLELDKGVVYQLDPSRTNNIHIAVLGLCYAAKKSRGGASVLNLLEDTEEHEPYDETVMPFTI